MPGHLDLLLKLPLGLDQLLGGQPPSPGSQPVQAETNCRLGRNVDRVSEPLAYVILVEFSGQSAIHSHFSLIDFCPLRYGSGWMGLLNLNLSATYLAEFSIYGNTVLSLMFNKSNSFKTELFLVIVILDISIS